MNSSQSQDGRDAVQLENASQSTGGDVKPNISSQVVNSGGRRIMSSLCENRITVSQVAALNSRKRI